MAIVAHVAGGDAPRVTGILLIADNALTLAATALLAMICSAVGSAALRTMRVAVNEPAAHFAFGLVLGSGLMATALLAVCAVAGVNLRALIVAVVGLALLARHEIALAPGRVAAALRHLSDAHPPGWSRRVGAIGLVLLTTLLLILALPPATDWDSLAYHLDVPARWVYAGAIHLPPDNYHSAFVGLAHALYLPLLALGLSSGPSILSVIFALATGVACFAIGRELFGPKAGVIGFWLLWASPVLVLVSLSPRVDLTLALFLLMGHFALIQACRGRGGAPMLLLAGVLLGMSVGVKYHALPYGLALAPLIVVAAVRIGERNPRRTGILLAAFSLSSLAATAPWLLKNWILIGAPLYPILASVRVEPWLAALHAPGLRPQGVDAGVFEFSRQMRAPFNLVDYLLRPGRLAPDADAFYSRPNLALFLAPVALVLPQWRLAAALAGPALVYVVLLLVASRYTSLRYLIAAIPALTIVAAMILGSALARLSRLGRTAVVFVSIAVAIPTLVALKTRFAQSLAAEFALGAASRREYLHDYPETAPHMGAVDWVNAHLSSRDTVLMLFEGRGFYFQVPNLQDMAVRNWAYIQPRAARGECLEHAGFTHILVNDGIANYFRNRGARLETLRWDEFEDYRAACLELIHGEKEFRLFQLRRRQPTTPR